jgi:hypothetical protein
MVAEFKSDDNLIGQQFISLIKTLISFDLRFYISVINRIKLIMINLPFISENAGIECFVQDQQKFSKPWLTLGRYTD